MDLVPDSRESAEPPPPKAKLKPVNPPPPSSPKPKASSTADNDVILDADTDIPPPARVRPREISVAKFPPAPPPRRSLRPGLAPPPKASSSSSRPPVERTPVEDPQLFKDDLNLDPHQAMQLPGAQEAYAALVEKLLKRRAVRRKTVGSAVGGMIVGGGELPPTFAPHDIFRYLRVHGGRLHAAFDHLKMHFDWRKGLGLDDDPRLETGLRVERTHDWLDNKVIRKAYQFGWAGVCFDGRPVGFWRKSSDKFFEIFLSKDQ